MPRKIGILVTGVRRSWNRGKKYLGHSVEAQHRQSFEWIATRVASMPDLQLVVVADYDQDKEGLKVLISGLDSLAQTLGRHPNHPSVCFLDPRLLPMEDPFKGVGVEIGINPEELLERRVHV